jgi:hypothetical protein
MKRTAILSLSCLIVSASWVWAADEYRTRTTNSRIQNIIRGQAGEYPISDYQPQEVQRSGEMVNQLTNPGFEYRRKFAGKQRRRKPYSGFGGPPVGEERVPYYGTGQMPQPHSLPVPKINRSDARHIRESSLMLQQLIREQN